MAFQHISCRIDGTLATITIERPQVLNALNEATMRELGEAFESLRANQEVRGVILTGSGEKAFIAGADIQEFERLTPAQAAALSRLGQRVTRTMETVPVPVLACINGFCLGGGMEMALACDFMIASPNAKLGLPEVSLGLIPGWGGTQRLARLVGPNRARYLIFSAAKISAEEALNDGILQAIYPLDELLGKGREILEKMNQNSPFAIAQAKRAVQEGLQVDLDRGLALEEAYFGLCFQSADLREGVAAFQAKRKPQFVGR